MSVGSQIDAVLVNSGFVRTDVDCHGCRDQNLPDKFIATINYDLNGNHQIECPRCAHIHYRVIKNGRVTSERFDSGYPTHKIERRNVWKAQDVPIISSTASAFMRDRWLNRSSD